MTRRLVATGLWFYATLYAGAYVTHVTGTPDVLTAIPAVALAAFVGVDPMGRIWGPKPKRERAARTAPGALPHPLP